MTATEIAADNNVARETPEEIKKGLEHCGNGMSENCAGCTYRQHKEASCILYLAQDSLAYIQQLENKVKSLEVSIKMDQARHADTMNALAQVERERDAAVKDLEDSADCEYCEHEPIFHVCPETNCHACERDCPCARCSFRQKDGFKWRGPCPENTKEEK